MILPISAGKVVTVGCFYQATSLIGSGRYAEVYKTFDAQLNSDAALKLYISGDDRAHKRANAEYETLTRVASLKSEYFPRPRRSTRYRSAGLNHPVVVMELGGYYEPDGTATVLTLSSVLERTPRPAGSLAAGLWQSERLLSFVKQLAYAVAQLHQLGIIHRDLKPSNILLKQAAGQSSPIPFLLDFNSSPADGVPATGTPQYLPPETRARSGAAATKADDVWAVAMLMWHMFHGLGAEVAKETHFTADVPEELGQALTRILLRALSVDPALRYQTSKDLAEALEEIAQPSGTQDGTPEMTQGEFLAARGAMQEIRWVMEDTLWANRLHAPKEIVDGVTTTFAWLSSKDTQALDLAAELERLGPRAIGVCLQQAFKIPPESSHLPEIEAAVRALAMQDPTMGRAAAAQFIRSGHAIPRKLARALLEELKSFPSAFLEVFSNDNDLMAPEELEELGRLALRFCEDQQMARLCRILVRCLWFQYLRRPSDYRRLANGLARQMGALQASETAEELVNVVTNAPWRDSRPFVNLDGPDRRTIESGLIELLADAYAACRIVGIDALDRVPRKLPGDHGAVYPFRRFLAKLTLAVPHEANEWVRQHPEDTPLQTTKPASGEDLAGRSAGELLGTYLREQDRDAYNELRFSRDPAVVRAVFPAIKAVLNSQPSETDIQRILELLKGFQSRRRSAVVRTVLDAWRAFEDSNCEGAISVLAQADISEPALKREVVEVMNRYLGGPYGSAARQGLKKLLD